MTKNALSLAVLSALLAVTASVGAPAWAVDPPAKSTDKSSAESKATPVRLSLQLIRTDVMLPAATPVYVTIASPAATPATPAAVPATTPAAPVTPLPLGPVTLATPTLITLDGSTATIAVTGGDLGYTISLSPTLVKDGKMLVLWNVRLSGKSLPGATGVSATGTTRIDIGPSAGIAEISLTDPTTGRMATFRLQGVAVTGDAASAPLPVNPAPAVTPAGVPAVVPIVVPTVPAAL